jgi:hypothetical protein
MKSIVALLFLAAVCYADIQKDGGLKGSWDDTFSITSTFDNTAPGVGYDGTSDFWTYDAETNITGTYDYNYASFAITNEGDDFYYQVSGGTAGYMVDFVTGADVDDPTNSLVTSCSLSYDNTVSCTVYAYGGSGQALYTPVITVWDEEGNHGTYYAAEFTDVDRPVTYMVYDHTPDTTAPTLSSPTIDGADVVLPSGDTYDDMAYVDVAVVVSDHEDSDEDDYDMWASGVRGVWAVVINADDIGADDEADLEWSEALMMDSYVSGSNAENWAIRFGFANWAPLGEWRIRRFTAVDFAGNWADELAFDESVTITWDASNEDEVTACQTLTMLETSDTDATDGDDAYVYFTLGCTEKYSGNNYGYVSFASPMYIMDGDTVKSSVVVGGGGYGYTDNVYQTGDIDYSLSAGIPGVIFTSFDGSSTTAATIILADGQADVEVGDWTLYEVITFTETGAVQRYTIELGAASSVVPSIVAVAFAALFAMLRL